MHMPRQDAPGMLLPTMKKCAYAMQPTTYATSGEGPGAGGVLHRVLLVFFSPAMGTAMGR